MEAVGTCLCEHKNIRPLGDIIHFYTLQAEMCFVSTQNILEFAKNF